MKIAAIMMMVMMLMAGAVAAEEQAAMPGQDYIIGPGDVLDISVWKVEELTKLVTVLPDGKIAFPLIGQIVAGGKTVAQLSKEIEKKLAKFVPDLTLNVMVMKVNSMAVYVIGEVKNPGRFELNSKINVLQALAMARGLDVFAKPGKIMIYRQAGKGTEIIGFDYDDVIDGKNLGQNILLQRGDVIVVP